ncbi:uncharacterized protein LOC135833997 [Planococcus citri]|uniref:uncharacterized protein LOC135833997 n=1 Tax=Planococcus citri TaxID=170843 RepID=UPI0031F78168
MTETVSEVYDLAYPSPITLKQISSIVIVVRLWRREIDTYFESNINPDEFNLTEHIQLKNLIPDMPSTIYNTLSNYIVTFRKSIEKWLRYHCANKVFISPEINKHRCFNNILRRFHDFAWDWNGAINYVRTARRMLQCDRFSDEEKFAIACLYYFEDDIKRIWPSVSTTKMRLGENSVRACPQLFYWANHMPAHSCNPYSYYNLSIYGVFNLDPLDNLSSVEYFWNRFPVEGRSRTAVVIYERCVELFARFILPQLSEHQLEEFITERAPGLIFRLLMCDSRRYAVLPTWMYIRNQMSEDQFHKLIMDLLSIEAEGDFVEEWLKLCREIWYSAPRHMKQPVFDDLLSEESSFLRSSSRIERSKPRRMKFLITVLHDVTFEERNAFWHKHWCALIRNAEVEDLLEMMNLCFRNEHEIRVFKNDIMCKYENFDYYCITSLKEGRIDKLNEYLDFCCPDEQKRRQLKQRLLRENLVSTVGFQLYYEFKSLNEFIDDAFERNDARVEFKSTFITSPMTEQFLFKFIREGDFALLMKFVDTFVSQQPVIEPLKTRLYDYFKEQLIAGWFRTVQLVNTDDVRRVLMWLLGNEDQVTRFKQSLPVDDVFRNIVQSKLKKRRNSGVGGGKPSKFPKKLHYFLMWYFNQDDEEIDNFKQRFRDELKIFVPRS